VRSGVSGFRLIRIGHQDDCLRLRTALVLHRFHPQPCAWKRYPCSPPVDRPVAIMWMKIGVHLGLRGPHRRSRPGLSRQGSTARDGPGERDQKLWETKVDAPEERLRSLVDQALTRVFRTTAVHVEGFSRKRVLGELWVTAQGLTGPEHRPRGRLRLRRWCRIVYRGRRIAGQPAARLLEVMARPPDAYSGGLRHVTRRGAVPWMRPDATHG